MENVKELNAAIIKEFRENDGKIGGQFEGADFLILHTTGARSGQKRLSPMAYLPRDGRYYVFAVGLADLGPERRPAWFHNLVSNPEVAIEVGSQTIPATARVLHGEELARSWDSMIAHNSHFVVYQDHLEFPSIELTSKPA